jgi:hypothetical protein
VLNFLEIEAGRQDKQSTRRVTAILRQLGRERSKQRINKRQIWVWGNPLSTGDSSHVSQETHFQNNEKSKVINSVGSGGTSCFEVKEDTENSPVPPEPTKNQTLLFSENSKVSFSDTSPHVDGEKSDRSSPSLHDRKQGDRPTSPVNETIKMKIASPLGDVKAIAAPIDSTTYEVKVEFPDGTTRETTTTNCPGEEKAQNRLRHIVARWLKNLNFRVSTITPTGYVWIDGCQCIKVSVNPVNRATSYVFRSPSGEEINIFDKKDFELQQ